MPSPDGGIVITHRFDGIEALAVRAGSENNETAEAEEGA